MSCKNKLPPSLQLPSIYSSVLSYEEQINLLYCTVNQILSIIDNDLTVFLKDYIDKRFNEIMVKAIYNPSTETIYFSIPEVDNNA